MKHTAAGSTLALLFVLCSAGAPSAEPVNDLLARIRPLISQSDLDQRRRDDDQYTARHTGLDNTAFYQQYDGPAAPPSTWWRADLTNRGGQCIIPVCIRLAYLDTAGNLIPGYDLIRGFITPPGTNGVLSPNTAAPIAILLNAPIQPAPANWSGAVSVSVEAVRVPCL